MNLIRRGWNWAFSRFLRRLADAHRHFGNEYGNQQEYQAAIGNYTRAIARDPHYALPYYSRGVLYCREIGDYDAAVEDLTRAIELDPRRPKAHFNRGLAYKMRMDYDEAIADFEQYLKVGQDEFWLDAAHRQLAELEDREAGALVP